MIAMNINNLQVKTKGHTLPPQYHYMEIHPSLMLGVLASNIPFPDHNQSPRNTYQSAMGKQAVGVYCTNYLKRFDTLGHILNYPQKPLVSTKMSKFLNGDELPNGINAVIAIATYTGFNQEDSIILNKSAVDRGLFRSTFYRTYKEQANKNHSTGEEEIFIKPNPDNTVGIKPYNYDKLEPNGFIKENTYVESGDIVIGKCMPQKKNGVLNFKDNSIMIRNGENGYIDKNSCNDSYFKNINGDGYVFSKVRIRSERIPCIGDKLSSRHGQKGSLGMMYRHEDMPFSSNGIVPDLIINPHAIPSRMTIGQLFECIMSKSAAGIGSYGDSTPFTDLKLEDIADVLQDECGYQRYGDEIMYNGHTGEQIHTQIYMGPTFYQRLKHMVDDKIHSRGGNGPVVLLTRQPAEGRARDGGLRFGEMERDAMISHGASAFLKERLLDVSDNYVVHVCNKCGIMGTSNMEKNTFNCKRCINSVDFSEVRIPYACKLFFHELMSMNVNARMITNE